MTRVQIIEKVEPQLDEVGMSGFITSRNTNHVRYRFYPLEFNLTRVTYALLGILLG